MRAKQKAIYDELNWPLPAAGAATAKKGKSAAKRSADDEGEGGEAKVPVKKAKVARKKKTVDGDKMDSGAEVSEESGGVKEEEEEEV